MWRRHWMSSRRNESDAHRDKISCLRFWHLWRFRWLSHYSPINSLVVWPDGVTRAQISHACTKMFNMYICIHQWLWSHKAYLRNICVSFSAVWEVCGVASTGLAQSLFVCVCVCYCSTYPLSSSFDALNLSRHSRGPDVHKQCSFPFPPHLSHFPPTLGAPAPPWWEQLLFVH